MMRTTDGKLAILDFGLMTEVTVSFAWRLHIIPVLYSLLRQYYSLINHSYSHSQTK